MTRTIRVIVPILVIGAIGSGCYVGIRPHRGLTIAAGVPLIEVAPPAPRVEVYGTAPYPDAFWVEGYWYWDAGDYRWRDGHWEKHRSGHAWVPHRWERDGNGWRLHEGHWEVR